MIVRRNLKSLLLRAQILPTNPCSPQCSGQGMENGGFSRRAAAVRVYVMCLGISGRKKRKPRK